MKKKPYKYLKFYHESIEAGNMVLVEGGKYRTSGLCDAFDFKSDLYPEFKLLIPTDYDFIQLGKEGKSIYTWASDSDHDLYNEFTPLRQTIVLFLAAMNGEL
jgi:hypothetical protein